MPQDPKSKPIEEKSKIELIEEALLNNVSGGTNNCGTDAGAGCMHDTCYDGSCTSPSNMKDPTPSEVIIHN